MTLGRPVVRLLGGLLLSVVRVTYMNYEFVYCDFVTQRQNTNGKAAEHRLKTE